MRSWIFLYLIFLLSFRLSYAEVSDSILIKLNDLVKEYDISDEPGYALTIIKNQEIIFKHASGLANLEYNIPLTTRSIFNIASISKQFTAATVAMLSLEEKLSLDEPVTTYLPELPDIYKAVQLKHMIHMESGIRDFYILHHLRGRGENIYSTTIGEVLELLSMQKSLYFVPGDQFDYCNTNYLLLAEIVKRVSGKSLRELTEERIFKPLGMVNSHFHDDRTEIVKNRATAYFLGEFSEIFIYRDIHSDTANIRKGYKIAPESFVFDLVGQSQLYTTVEDLFLWDRNFYTGEVGGRELIDLLLTKSKFNSGEVNNYAFGLVHGERGAAGLKTISHTGGTNGYLSNFIRFPEEEFSIIFITNNTGFDDSIINRAIQICLNDRLSVVSRGLVMERQVFEFSQDKFDAYQGIFELMPDFTLTFSHDNNQYFVDITGQESVEIFPSSDTTFFLKVVDAEITFHTDKEGNCEKLTWHQSEQHYPASRITEAGSLILNPEQFTGSYYSEELDITYRVYFDTDQLYIQYKTYLPIFTKPLKPTGELSFNAQAMWKVEFEKDEKGSIVSLTLTSPVGTGPILFSKIPD